MRSIHKAALYLYPELPAVLRTCPGGDRFQKVTPLAGLFGVCCPDFEL